MDTIQREEKAEVARRETSYCFLLETFERVRDDMRSGLESMKALVSSLYFLVFSLATRVISIGVSLVVESNTFIFFKIDLIGTFVDNTRSLPRPSIQLRLKVVLTLVLVETPDFFQLKQDDYTL